jgi:hypothetical protein
MTYVNKIVSSVLFALGATFVLAGMSAALGFTFAGMLASLAAIVTLLYAGGTWFGTPRDHFDSVLVFDRALRVTRGAASGTHVSVHFPGTLRCEIEASCAAAFMGQATHFTCEQNGIPLTFAAAPIRGADGTILYGVLLAEAGVPAPAALV